MKFLKEMVKLVCDIKKLICDIVKGYRCEVATGVAPVRVCPPVLRVLPPVKMSVFADKMGVTLRYVLKYTMIRICIGVKYLKKRYIFKIAGVFALY